MARHCSGRDGSWHLVQIAIVQRPIIQMALVFEHFAHPCELLVGIHVRTEEQEIRCPVVRALDDFAVVRGTTARVGPIQEDLDQPLDLLDNLVWSEDSEDAEPEQVAREPALQSVLDA